MNRSITFLSDHKINEWIQGWVNDETENLTLGILATVDSKGIPHSRCVSVREINKREPLFFTQKGSQKVKQIESNSAVSMTISLIEKKRQLIFEGIAEALSEEENVEYWSTYPKLAQTRFMVYGPQSGNLIADNSMLDAKLQDLLEEFKNAPIERPEAYVGYRIKPTIIKMYQLNGDRISDSYVGFKDERGWKLQRVVP